MNLLSFVELIVWLLNDHYKAQIAVEDPLKGSIAICAVFVQTEPTFKVINRRFQKNWNVFHYSKLKNQNPR
ncbi:MAG: hypothetical protein ACI8RD_010768 [Bacillariaceae sp.]|jgi:hypothetical protein